MKPCSENRKPLALLAIGALETGRDGKLRAHLETCAACRDYLAEISNVAATLRAVEPDSQIRASDAFHRKTVAAMKASTGRSGIESLVQQMRSLLDWRVALPAVALLAVVIAVLSASAHRPGAVFVPATPMPIVSVPIIRPDIAPSLAHYEMVANQSLDNLDELITLQGRRSPPSTPSYTASTFPRWATSD